MEDVVEKKLFERFELRNTPTRFKKKDTEKLDDFVFKCFPFHVIPSNMVSGNRQSYYMNVCSFFMNMCKAETQFKCRKEIVQLFITLQLILHAFVLSHGEHENLQYFTRSLHK